MPDLHRRLADLFATEFVVHRAGAEDPNVAAAERVLQLVGAQIQAEAFTMAANAIEHAATENGVDDVGGRLAVMSLRAMAEEAAKIAEGGGA